MSVVVVRKYICHPNRYHHHDCSLLRLFMIFETLLFGFFPSLIPFLSIYLQQTIILFFPHLFPRTHPFMNQFF